jgi:hypothetical protein
MDYQPVLMVAKLWVLYQFADNGVEITKMTHCFTYSKILHILFFVRRSYTINKKYFTAFYFFILRIKADV